MNAKAERRINRAYWAMYVAAERALGRAPRELNEYLAAPAECARWRELYSAYFGFDPLAA